MRDEHLVYIAPSLALTIISIMITTSFLFTERCVSICSSLLPLLSFLPESNFTSLVATLNLPIKIKYDYLTPYTVECSN